MVVASSRGVCCGWSPSLDFLLPDTMSSMRNNKIAVYTKNKNDKINVNDHFGYLLQLLFYKSVV